MPPPVEILTKQLNYKCFQKPDKRGKPLVAEQKAVTKEGESADMNNSKADQIFLNDSFKLEVQQSNTRVKLPIKAINVSRSPYDDPGLTSLPTKVSDIKKGDRPNISMKQESTVIEHKTNINMTQNKGIPTKEQKTTNPMIKSTVIKPNNNMKKIETEKNLDRSKSPLSNGRPQVVLSKNGFKRI